METLLSKIMKSSFNVILQGDNFRITPSSKLTPIQKEFLKSHKFQILNELKNEALLIKCYTPNGMAIEVEASSREHADWLQKMNPKPKQITI